MAIVKDAGRQNLLYATQKITQAMLANTDGAYDAVDLPPGARFVSGALAVDTAWNDGTAATLSVGISGGSATAYLAATSIQATGVTAFTGGDEALLPSGQTINVTAAFTGEDATVGQATLIVAYIIDGRGTEAQ